MHDCDGGDSVDVCGRHEEVFSESMNDIGGSVEPESILPLLKSIFPPNFDGIGGIELAFNSRQQRYDYNWSSTSGVEIHPLPLRFVENNYTSGLCPVWWSSHYPMCVNFSSKKHKGISSRDARPELISPCQMLQSQTTMSYLVECSVDAY
uniref:Uncharacterized protein n=1 Tax=Oryza sativa subsp. japonica TaxID=39947 RepID=Q6K4G4_ORYSJ|nr:hypothetical protein [Oryza sativa Japonica Group]BAD25992.1 hypothetical protein [Oryza sativa Japonica Group]